jgi:predicted Zn-dependent protease
LALKVPEQTSVRMLAPAALVAFAIVFLIVVVASLDEGSSSRDADSARDRNGSERRGSEPRRRATTRRRRFYVVRSGDTLLTIASRTGVSVEQLRALNPTIDPQGLVSGQRIKLRE